MSKMYYCWGELGPFQDLDGMPVMHSAGVAWNNPGSGDWNGHVPDASSLFFDSGGFQVTSKWDLKYPYSPEAYFEYAESCGADYVAGMDYACEPSLHDSDPIDRVAASVMKQDECRGVYDRGDYSFEFVPVVQGWTVEEYDQCIDWMEREGLIRPYMAIGTVCKRKDLDAIAEVLSLCESRLPETEWHLFGATLRVWKDDRFSGRFRSSDTAAWKWGAESKDHKRELLEDYQRKVRATVTGSDQQVLS